MVLNGTSSQEDTVVSANLHVINCKHLLVTAQILGSNASQKSQLSNDPFIAEIFGNTIFMPKSFALIYAHNETRSMDRFVKIGRRQTDDIVLTFDEIIVKKELNSFPQHEIEYNLPNVFITQIEFQLNVSFSSK